VIDEKSTVATEVAKPLEPHKQWVETVRHQVGSVRFGVVQIVIHNGRVVQIEKTEKIRFDQPDDR
jgi:hypothetical protein